MLEELLTIGIVRAVKGNGILFVAFVERNLFGVKGGVDGEREKVTVRVVFAQFRNI